MSGRKRVFVLAHETARRNALQAVQGAPSGYAVTVGEATRSLAQNDALWGVLAAFSEQLEWPVNGRMTKLPADDWKHLLSAAFRKDQRIAEGLDGGFVFLGQRTSQMGKREFSEFLEFAIATAAERGVDLEGCI